MKIRGGSCATSLSGGYLVRRLGRRRQRGFDAAAGAGGDVTAASTNAVLATSGIDTGKTGLPADRWGR